MRDLTTLAIDRYRFTHPMVGVMPDAIRPWAGAFEIPYRKDNSPIASWLRVIVSRGGSPFDGGDPTGRWDHVSVSTKVRSPTWEEMEFIKRLFFEPGECAMQLHVPTREHINNHEFCLHIWRPLDHDIPRPPSIMVGVPGLRLPA